MIGGLKIELLCELCKDLDDHQLVDCKHGWPGQAERSRDMALERTVVCGFWGVGQLSVRNRSHPMTKLTGRAWALRKHPGR
jgi:hypothetical protein